MGCIRIMRQNIGEGLQRGLDLESYMGIWSRILGRGSPLIILRMCLLLSCVRWIKLIQTIRKNLKKIH